MMLAAVLTLGVAATSCGDDDDEDIIHGLYIGEGTATFWDDGELITEQATEQAQFNSDGTGFIMDNEGEIDLFNDFKVANGHLMIRWTGDNEYEDAGAIAIQGHNFTLSDEYSEDERIVVVFTRVNDKDNTNFDFWTYLEEYR